MVGEPGPGVALRERGDPLQPGVLLWPGLGSTGAYFAGVAPRLAGRTVAVDPPGSGGSPALDPCTYERLVELARKVIDDRGCTAMVGHSLGAYVAFGVGCRPPEGLRAVVLIDGGFMRGTDMVALGMPVLSARADLLAWLRSNELRFPDWGSTVSKLTDLVGAEATPAFEAYLHEVFVEVDGEVGQVTSRDRVADLLIAVFGCDAMAQGRALEVPTLLLACGQPLATRPVREQAWQAFVDAYPSVELQVADDWGHNAIWQAPEASSKLIADWLRDHV
ncbi:MAG: alpha/beta fold hydrolase [Acidimicrobiales bacterium]